jgi:simple sugar transport system permease protein
MPDMIEFAQTLSAFFIGPWSSAWFAGNTLDSAALLLTAGLGVLIALRAGLFNLGVDGQIYLGGTVAAAVFVATGAVDGGTAGAFALKAGGLLSLTAAIAAFLAGAFAGAFCGMLKKRAGANELITTFLLSSGLSPVCDALVSGPLRMGQSSLMATPLFSRNVLLPRLLEPSALSISAILAVVFCLLYSVYMNFTGSGYRYRIAGTDPLFARYGGINPERYWTPALFFSGGLAGLTGYFAVAGTYGFCGAGFSGGMGWSAFTVALIASRLTRRAWRLDSVALLLAALCFAWLLAGANSVVLLRGVSIEIASLCQALVLALAVMQFGSGRLKSFPGNVTGNRSHNSPGKKREAPNV